MLLLTMLDQVVLTFESVNKFLRCDHSNVGSLCVMQQEEGTTIEYPANSMEQHDKLGVTLQRD